MDNDKIYLRPQTREDGSVILVDQDGRKVAKQLKLKVERPCNGVVSFTLEALASDIDGGYIRGWGKKEILTT